MHAILGLNPTHFGRSGNVSHVGRAYVGHEEILLTDMPPFAWSLSPTGREG